MAITESLARLGATLVAVVQTRLELAAVEVEEESLRLGGYLLQSLLALFFLGVAALLLAMTVIIVFWDSYRIAAVLSMAGLFGVLGLVMVTRVQGSLKTKPRLLAHTIAELNKDINLVKASIPDHEQ